MLPAVQDAVARDRKVTFEYTRADGEKSSRTVDPLGLVCKAERVVPGGAEVRRGMRSYRVSRMREVVVLAMAARRPARFDLAKHWKRSTADLAETAQALAATLALSPKGVAVACGDGWQLVPGGRVESGQPVARVGGVRCGV